MWEKTTRIFGQKIGTPLHIKIWNNPSISMQGTALGWKTWKDSGSKVLLDVVTSSNIHSFKDLKDTFNLKDTETFRYLQLKNWIRENCDIENDVPSTIKKLLIQNAGKGLVSKLYHMFITANDNEDLLHKILYMWAGIKIWRVSILKQNGRRVCKLHMELQLTKICG